MRNTEGLAFLCIGGPEDGKWVVPERTDVHRCVELLSARGELGKVIHTKPHVYTYAILGGDRKIYYLMLHESLKMNEALDRILNVYSTAVQQARVAV